MVDLLHSLPDELSEGKVGGKRGGENEEERPD